MYHSGLSLEFVPIDNDDTSKTNIDASREERRSKREAYKLHKVTGVVPLVIVRYDPGIEGWS